MNDAQADADLKALQDDIYREKILRARKMSPEARLADALELTNFVFGQMHTGAMWQLGTTDEARGWEEVRRRVDVISRVHDEGRFTSTRPSAA